MRKAERQRIVDGLEKLVQLQQENLALMKRVLPLPEVEDSDPELRCALCGRSREAVRQMIKGTQGAICGECIERSSDILAGIKAGAQA